MNMMYATGIILWISLLWALPRYWRRQTGYKRPLLTDLSILYQRRYLIRVWLIYRIQSRYAQTLLGVLWIALLPLLSAGVMAFALTEVLGITTADNTPYVAFLLSGQVFFNLFSNTILQSKQSLLGMVGVANQIYFPREIILILLLGETLIDFGFGLLTVIVINAALGIYPTWVYFWLVVPFTILLMLTAGVALIVSWWSVLIRDFQPLITVMMQFLFFLLPILYPLAQVPELYRPWIALNPLAPLIDSGRNILIFHQIPVWGDLLLPSLVAVTLCYLGYIYFKVNEDRLGDWA